MNNTVNSIIESIGAYLPPTKVSTKEVLAGCENHVRVPLERLTGIRSRHFAGETEFSIDLARQAVQDCLDSSQLKAAEFDLIISANISRWDAPGIVSYEPSTAAVLKREFGFDKAQAYDISNACASMWTAVYVVDSLIRAGAIRAAMVVSGEYISHLTRTAQKEIVDYLDPQLASLTLGDAGMALSMTASNRPDAGFRDIEIYTLSRYSRFCIAKPTDKAHGGAAMHTDAVKVTASVVPHAASHAEQMLRRSGEHLKQINHIIPHQTSRLTMQDALREIASRFDTECGDQLINNLAERGNTASTAHFLALRDSIDSSRVNPGDKILFAISGSGQTTGTALYTCDDLPERVRMNGSAPARAPLVLPQVGATLAMPFCIESLAQFTPERGETPDTLTMLAGAARGCLDQSEFSKEEIELLISVGVYRTEFLTEPALAALLAGDLEMNDASDVNDQKTLAFDVLNGPAGFLNACHMVSEMARAGRVERAMIVASELENNATIDPDNLLGLREMGSAVILRESEDGETGFQAFVFDQYNEYHDMHRVVCKWNADGKTYLDKQIHSGYEKTLVECIGKSVAGFLKEQQLTLDELKYIFPPQISSAFAASLAAALQAPADMLVDVAQEGLDYATSSTMAGMEAVLNAGSTRPGDLGLVINAGSGIQVACALYQF